MKLLRFKAEKVYGYLKFDIKFDDKLSFLVGGNGSGKTTLLKLIQAVLTPNLKDIHLIPFTEIELEIQNSSKNYEIKVEKSENGIEISLNNDTTPLKLPYKDIDELSYILSKEENLFNRELFHHRNNETFKFIKELDVPLFLGLERRESSRDDEESYYRHEQVISRNGERKVIRKNRYIDGSLGISLLETQEIIRFTYAKIREEVESQRKRLRDDILLTSFHFSDIDDLLDNNGNFKEISLQEQKNITSKKEDIFKALNISESKLGGNDWENLRKFSEIHKIVPIQKWEDGIEISLRFFLHDNIQILTTKEMNEVNGLIKKIQSQVIHLDFLLKQEENMRKVFYTALKHAYKCSIVDNEIFAIISK